MLLQQHVTHADGLIESASAAEWNLLVTLNACWVVMNPGEELTEVAA
jgi:hypothetical protein